MPSGSPLFSLLVDDVLGGWKFECVTYLHNACPRNGWIEYFRGEVQFRPQQSKGKGFAEVPEIVLDRMSRIMVGSNGY